MGNFFQVMKDGSSIGQYRSAKASGDKAAMGNAVIGGVMSGISGLTGILDTSLQLAQGHDASQYTGQLADMRALGEKQYTDYGSLINDMVTANRGFTVEKGSLGPTDGEIGKGVATSALAGAQAGMQIGGPWGAAIGAVVGGGSALAGGLYGKTNGRLRESILNMQSDNQRDINILRFQNKADRIREDSYGQMYANRAAEGGRIEIRPENRGKFTEAARRNHMSVQQFAKRVLAKDNARRYSETMRRRAQFARNAAGWKHADGGQLNKFNEGGDVDNQDNTHGIPRIHPRNVSTFEDIPKTYNPEDYRNGIGFYEFFRQLKHQLGIPLDERIFDGDVKWYAIYNKYTNANDYPGLINELNKISTKEPLPAIPGRIRNNTTPTAEKSSSLENIIVKQIYNDDSSYDPAYAPEFAIPWGGDENMIYVGNGEEKYRVTPNVLDSIAKYAGPNMANIPIVDALGLSAQETQFGRVPLYNIDNPGTHYTKREIGNVDVLRNFGILPAEALVRDFAYTANKTSKNIPPLLHAFKYFKSGKYNPRDPNHTGDVRARGNNVFYSPAAQNWWENEGKYWYYGTSK